MVLVTAFGYAIVLLGRGTDRIDKASAERVAEAEAERDRARSETISERQRLAAECAGRVAALEDDRNYWRGRALGNGG